MEADGETGPTEEAATLLAATQTVGSKEAPARPPHADVPTPQQRRPALAGNALGQPAGSAPEAGAEGGVPVEARDLSWPATFCDTTKGERLELSEDGTLVKRTSGVGHGVAFVGPLSLENGLAYFEVEVAEMEPKRSQTLAIGVCCSLPTAKVLRVERARELGHGSYILGYDLPKVYVHGTEVSKINTKQWRPLKELAVGDRVGLLIARPSMELTVFVNGVKKASARGLGSGSSEPGWQDEVWGVIDVHGTVRAASLRRPAPSRRSLQRSCTVPQDLGERVPASASTQPQAPPCTAGSQKAPSCTVGSQKVPAAGIRRGASGLEATQGLKKRLRMTCHPCGCMVHLIQHTSDVVHVPRKGDFVIGRNPKSCNLTLDSSEVPNMVSRRHAVIVSDDDAVILQDCESLNGTFVNGRRVGRETLRQGDTLVIGNPAQSPVDFRFSVSMPPCT
mmetsp:Transcript_1979/g.5322  ORF Transcript_1979/g.5322 Transcript_1979/m.5322 type:complete len:449 (-) Transcript_1979:174-1520(-)